MFFTYGGEGEEDIPEHGEEEKELRRE